jgi:TonB family protein
MSKIDKLLVVILAVLVIGIGFNTFFLLTGCEKSREGKSMTAPSKVAENIPEFVPYDIPPKQKHITQPEYPKEAKKAGIEGTVYLRIAIDASGEVLDVKIAKGVDPILDSAAVAAAKTWSYEPAMSKGKTVGVWIGQPVTFRLTKEEKRDKSKWAIAEDKSEHTDTELKKTGKSKSSDIPEFVAYDTPPKEKYVTQPKYPEEAKKAGIEGKVYLRIAIDITGEVLDVKVVKGVHQLLDNAAVAAAWSWSYYPAKKKDKPVPVWIGQPVTFRLSEGEK